MSILLLDTNISLPSVSEAVPDPKAGAWIHGHDDEMRHLSVVTMGELRKGLVETVFRAVCSGCGFVRLALISYRRPTCRCS